MVVKKLNLTENARTVLKKRYLIKNKKGEVVEVPEELFKRVASFIAKADKKYGASPKEIKSIEEKFHNIMTNLEFMPNSPTLMNAGRELGQLSACFVLPVEDSMEDIFEAIKSSALVHKSGGGTGFSFSRLRPKSSPVKSTGGVSSGPVSFMKVFNAATEAVKQGGCVTPDTCVSTEYGVVKIENLGPKNSKPNSWYRHNGRPFGVATDNGLGISDEFYNNGVSKVKKIKTTCGYSISTTPEHCLRSIDEQGNYVWRHVKDIKIGDWVVLQKDTYLPQNGYAIPKVDLKVHPNAKIIKIPQAPSQALGEFIGLFIGDGAMSINKRGTGRLIISIGDSDRDIATHLYKISNELFDTVPVLQKKDNDKSTNYFFCSTTLVHWLKDIGVEKKSAKDVYVPEIVFRAGRDFAYAFLRGLFSADGHITKEGYISLSSVSKKFIKGVQVILLSLGIPSGISITKERKSSFGRNPLYKLRIITKDGMNLFGEKIGFISNEKNKRLVDAKEKAWEFNDIIPNQGKLMREIYNSPGRGCGPGRTKKGANRKLYRDLQHYFKDISAARNLTRSRLQELVDEHQEFQKDSTIQWFLANKQFYDRVSHIEDNKSLTLDLSVPGSNTYIANGFVSHNTRRGANMGILRIDHPDILEFITCKENNKEITNFNISVTVTDDFMKKLEKGEDYDLIDPRTKKVVKQLNTKEVFDLIVKMAWKNGEPGLIFIDRMNEFNPTPKVGTYESTNPCGEQILLPYESCNLGSINLSRMTRESAGKVEVDWEKLGTSVDTAVRFLDNVIDQNKFPLPVIEKATLANRKIGLGVMGWADLLIMVGIPYNSEDAVNFAGTIMKFVRDRSKQASRKLAEERGAFPNFEMSVYYDRKESPIRNATTTTIAPTGTISIIAGSCSSGIEPLFALSYYRKVMDNNKLVEVNPYFEKVARERGFLSRELFERIAQKGSIQDFSDIPEDVRRVFVVSHDITPEWHIRMQAAFQKYTDNAVSKTINFPNEATQGNVEKAYKLAYKLGCKGLTIYRDRSREEQVLNIAKADTNPKASPKAGIQKTPRKRPSSTTGKTFKMVTGCGSLYITINEDEYGLCEVFSQMGKSGGCAASQSEATSRLVSLALRSGIAFEAILKQLRGIRCPSPLWAKGGMILSCPDAICKAIEIYVADKKKITDTSAQKKETSVSRSKSRMGNVVGVCPDCGNALIYKEGCMSCIDAGCGYSKCS